MNDIFKFTFPKINLIKTNNSKKKIEITEKKELSCDSKQVTGKETKI